MGDISNLEDVCKAFEGCDAVFHIAAAVGPYHSHPVFHKVNVVGTANVLTAMRKFKIPKLVAASTPSIFFDGYDISGKAPKDLKIVKPGHFLAAYAETKAEAERMVREACCDELLTVNVAPHQVYGPRDALFLPALMDAADKLRIMGNGNNLVSMSHVDNYSHGLILAHAALYKGSPVLGKFYLVTDGKPVKMWDVFDRIVVRQGQKSVYQKFKVPLFVCYAVAYLGSFVSYFTGWRFKLTPFNVTMLTIDRWFDISDAERDLKYKPLKTFDQGWEETMQWFDKNTAFWKACAAATFDTSGTKKRV